MALEHEFLNVSTENILPLLHLNNSLFSDKKIRYKNGEDVYWPNKYEDADDILLKIMTSRRAECIVLHDDIIRPILHNFETVNTLFGGFIPFSGLNYYGFTLIPPESIPTLISVLTNVKTDLKIDALLDLCAEATDKKQYILHSGI